MAPADPHVTMGQQEDYTGYEGNQAVLTGLE